ncbi:MAG: acryloyl-CoA reductase [Acidobacteriota bacterium]|nr:acryloyl-CoA reductase [Acidobacteriota bacterium]
MRAFQIFVTDDVLTTDVTDVTPRATDPSDVLVRVEFSGVNYKDAMVVDPRLRVRRSSRLIGGVDAAGEVVESSDPSLPIGARVAVHGGDLGVARDGGFAEYVYAPARFVSRLPEVLTTRDAMIVGTAGLSAMRSILALEDHGLGDGEVLVTGATGGVGSMAVALLAARGYSVTASTGSAESIDWLESLGASRVIGREEIADKPDRVLASERWAGAVDCVGGDTLAQILRSLRYGAAVAASGLVAGADLVTTVYPFITRAVALLGVDVVEMDAHSRARTWQGVADLAAHLDFDSLVDREVQLEHVTDALDVIRRGATRGRILVRPTPGG